MKGVKDFIAIFWETNDIFIYLQQIDSFFDVTRSTSRLHITSSGLHNPKLYVYIAVDVSGLYETGQDIRTCLSAVTAPNDSFGFFSIIADTSSS